MTIPLIFEKNCDSSLCLVLFVETPVWVFCVFDLGICTINFHPSDHCSDTGDRCPLV